MSGRSVKVFLRHWWRAFTKGVAGAAFGWAAAAAAVLVGLILWLFNIKMENAPPWALPLVGASLALLIAIVAHLFVVAPYRAMRMLSPFSTKIEYGYLASAYPRHQFEPQTVSIRIKNRTYLSRVCVVHVMSIDGVDNSNRAFPRFVSEAIIESGETEDVPILRWHQNQNITVCGPVAWGWGGNFVTAQLKYASA